MNKLLVFLAVALVLPVATALDCQGLIGDQEKICEDILQTSLLSTEKDLLILDLLSPNNYFPNHDFVYSWNVGLDIKNSPSGSYYNKGVIRSAWLDILAPMPSIKEDGVIYIPDRARILSEYNYNIRLPSGKERRDCKTKYYVKEVDEDLDVFVNGKFIGHDKLALFGISGNNGDEVILTTRLKISVRYRIKHYRKKDGRCKYKDSDYETDEITLIDTFRAKLYKNNLESSFEIIDKYNGATKGLLNLGESTSAGLSFANSFYQNTNYVYYLTQGAGNILTLNAQKRESSKINNLFINDLEEKIEFIVKDSSSCKLELFDHFNSKTEFCDLSYSEQDFEIETEKTIYKEGEKIFVEIFPKNLELNLTYGDKSILVKDSVEFTATLGQNEILAKLNNGKAKKIINVTDPANGIFLRELSSISLFGYIIYSFLRKYLLSFSLI